MGDVDALKAEIVKLKQEIVKLEGEVKEQDELIEYYASEEKKTLVNYSYDNLKQNIKRAFDAKGKDSSLIIKKINNGKEGGCYFAEEDMLYDIIDRITDKICKNDFSTICLDGFFINEDDLPNI